MNKQKLLAKTRNNPRDVRFSDLVLLVEAVGYTLKRISGSHHIYVHTQTPEPLNLQPDKHGKAKSYQVRQFLAELDRYSLTLENES